MAGTKIVSLLLVCMVVVAPMVTDAAITCGTVVSLISPCVNYLRGTVPLSQACCSGVKALNAQASTTQDRQTTCGCLKAAAGGVNANRAAGLPSQCGVNIPYKISPNTDCSKIT
ncbi:lipid transfer protein isoform 1.1 precursor [Tripterygium wilfordii]|uniref:Non-specific lipid-transfer protein n=1 Tax=Tripterygium wilfordii TaxID=458696 RepID=A0A7J7CTR7_TRIWF|nr:non-specific lipid-transfer protein 1-like [Tripterygium wilfordii]KAF5737286.1 lipid transfer protein isoform 1.1 precursor [Tripterygium wilfordii]